MAYLQDNHRTKSNDIHYTAVIPSTINGKGPSRQDSPLPQKQTELERAKAMYVDFEDAFQDETTNRDYFGYQPDEKPSTKPSKTDDNDDSKPANFYLQSIETISEVKNGNHSPQMRYQLSRENSRPSTPSDTPPFPQRSNQTGKKSHLNNSQRSTSSSNGNSQLSSDFTNLNLIDQNNDESNESPAPFTPDAIRIQYPTDQPFDDSLLVSSQFKLILPQYFLIKYLGRTPCSQLWGAKAVRVPIDEMVHSARVLSTINDMPTLEACVNTRGLVLTHRDSPDQPERTSRNPSPDRRQNGLIPLEYISYVMHDLKYSKIAACIVLRQSKTGSKSEAKSTNSDDTVTECYGFLFQSKEHAHRFALSLAEAFNARKRSSRHGKTSNHYDKREGRSPHRRTKQRNQPPSIPHHHERTRAGKYDDSYLRDSEV